MSSLLILFSKWSIFSAESFIRVMHSFSSTATKPSWIASNIPIFSLYNFVISSGSSPISVFFMLLANKNAPTVPDMSPPRAIKSIYTIASFFALSTLWISVPTQTNPIWLSFSISYIGTKALKDLPKVPVASEIYDSPFSTTLFSSPPANLYPILLWFGWEYLIPLLSATIIYSTCSKQLIWSFI